MVNILRNRAAFVLAVMAVASQAHASAYFDVDTADLMLTVTGVGGAAILVYLAVVGFHMAWSLIKRLKGKESIRV